VSEQTLREPPRVAIRKLASGVPGLDEVLGGGIPEYSFNLIAGAPGTGKTTLAQQILFANATPERPALFFTVLGEPPIKMLRYQQQFRFFEPSRVGVDVHFFNLNEEVLHKELDVVLQRISDEVERLNPSMVVVDSFRTVIRTTEVPGVSELDLQHFVQRLALRLTSWETTSFLIGEFAEGESRNPVFTVADGVVWLFNEVERNSTVRKLRVTKVRGQAAMPGLQTFRISDAGLEVYPRLSTLTAYRRPTAATQRQSTGVPELDGMMGGGIPAGDSVLVTGPTGSGKTILATQYVAAGVERGESAVIAVFEEHPQLYTQRAKSLGFDLEDMIARGKLEIMYLRPLDLSVDETLTGIQQRVERLHAERVVIDSLSGFEVALAPTFRRDFRESFYRLVQALSALGVSVISTIEVVESSDYLRFAPFNISFLADDILTMRYVELEGELRKVLAVVKMRSSDHSRALRAYAITSRGLEVREALRDYRGIITGVPRRRSGASDVAGVELTTTEATVLDALLRLGETAADQVANDTSLSGEQVRRAIDRLLAAGYVRGIDRDGQTLYRVVPRALG
jgi:circadian clock protein KaiC